jgi:hypothetical protein
VAGGEWREWGYKLRGKDHYWFHVSLDKLGAGCMVLLDRELGRPGVYPLLALCP